MKKIQRAIFVVLAILVAAFFMFLALHWQNIEVLNPEGEIAHKQLQLITIACILSIIVIVPVYALTFWIVLKYRADKNADYQPDWDHHVGLETLWWAIPGAIIFVLAIIAWQSSHALDPYKALASSKKPVEIQVVALQWKWLFIYPEEHIATVNYMQIPEKTPINLSITSDAPMNAFWVPKLGSQVYAMSGMNAQLHLMADHAGNYRGVSSNISGEGFADMHFAVKSTSDTIFRNWVTATRLHQASLTIATYEKLAKPGKANNPIYYGGVDEGLYEYVIHKYMPHDHNTTEDE